jgi:type VI secretion system secreted protein VgrG
MVAPFDPAALAPDTSTSTDLYRLTVEGFPASTFRVESFAGKEAMSEPYAFEIVTTTEGDPDREIERLALGQRASLAWNVGPRERAFYGVIAAVRLERVHDAGTRAVQYHLRFVPRLWLLKRRRQTRIFQQLSAPDIIAAVLREARIDARFQLLREYPVREYTTQYEESDLRFVQRLAAEAGMFFLFAQGASLDVASAGAGVIPGDTLFFGDDATMYPVIGGAEGGAADTVPPLYYLSSEDTAVSHADKVVHFVARSVVKATSTAYRDYDPERPMSHPTSAAPASPAEPEGPGSLASFTGALPAAAGLDLEVYDHHGPFLFPKWGWAAGEAALMLRQKRRRAFTTRGESGCPELSPGHRFLLANHPAGHLDRAWVLTSVEHQGRRHADRHHKVYWTSFTAVPAEVTFLPPRPRRKCVQVALTATVVGPPGEEIHVDALGQIKVQFHWDRAGRFDGKSSCWIRTTHPFAGAGWGVQFIPRVGQEVVVVFEGGDPDKPMVLGAVYNGTHPPPFVLPEQKTKSGIRTQSTPGGAGYNELRFEDRKGGEEVFVHAERDLVEIVKHDRTVRVGHDDRVEVQGGQFIQVHGPSSRATAGDARDDSAGNLAQKVAGDVAVDVGGSRSDKIGAQLAVTVAGGETRRTGGALTTTVAKDSTTEIGGRCSVRVGTKAEGAALSVKGNCKLTATGKLEVRADEGITILCGGTSFELTGDLLKLIAKNLVLAGSTSVAVMGNGPFVQMTDELNLYGKNVKMIAKTNFDVTADEKIRLTTPDASLKLDKDAKLKGGHVMLNCDGEDPPRGVDQKNKKKDPLPEKPMLRLVLKDALGKPYAGKKFTLTVDGAQVAEGTSAEDGLIEQEVSAGAQAGQVELELGEGRKLVVPLKLGKLPPVAETSGVKARLKNLGHYHGPVDAVADDDFARAVRSFQRDAGFKPTGEVDRVTRDKLRAMMPDE